MKYAICILGGLLFCLFCKMNNTSNENLYVIHTKYGFIRANYTNSRDSGLVNYYDASTKEQNWISASNVDSITVISENWWTCGPRGNGIKYISK